MTNPELPTTFGEAIAFLKDKRLFSDRAQAKSCYRVYSRFAYEISYGRTLRVSTGLVQGEAVFNISLGER